MGGSKRPKQVKQKEQPTSRQVSSVENPDGFYSQSPAWNFHTCDNQQWSLAQEETGNLIWDEIFPFLQNMEQKNWSDILVREKKKNHAISVESLNKVAMDRLSELQVEAESIISLRLNGTHRLYGYMVGAVFCTLWHDKDHGDNSDCVCRAYKKHT